MMTTSNKTFEAGKYYVVDCDNYVVFSSNNILECKEHSMDGDVILVALSPSAVASKKTTETKVVPFNTPKPDKIIVNFTKNVLTIIGSSVKLLNTEYPEGDVKFDSKDWVDLVVDCNKKAKCVEFIGEPVVQNGKDITNEMSDL